MIELYCNRVCGKDVWHDGRFIDTWAGEEITGELKHCCAAVCAKKYLEKM